MHMRLYTTYRPQQQRWGQEQQQQQQPVAATAQGENLQQQNIVDI
jgi:hypothetical protein